jgi:protein-disulfide isomerase
VTGRIIANFSNVAIVALVLASVASPEGPVRRWVSEFMEAKRVEALLEENKDDLVRGDRLGNPDTSEAIVLFIDYQCPFCRTESAAVFALLEDRPDMGLVIKHFPLVVHRQARRAALAAICAGVLGDFESMHRVLLDIDLEPFPRSTQLARIAGLPEDHLTSCMEGAEARSRLNDDLKLARSLGVRGTPTVVLGGELRLGVGWIEELQVR